MIRLLTIALFTVILAGCQDTEISQIPDPIELTAEAAGHYCQMSVLDHSGPKAQVHLAGNPNPLWFTQVRDAIAYARMPEQTAEISAIYVNDMGVTSATWDAPGTTNWIKLDDAFLVIESKKRGGMGAPELVPFSARDTAKAFEANHGGRVIAYDAVTDEMVLAPVDVELGPTGDHEPSEHMDRPKGGQG